MVDQYIRYRCENGFDFAVTYQGGGTRALVERSGYSDLLRLAPSASGARYTDGKLTLSAKADSAVLELPGGPTYRSCRSLPAKTPIPKK
jgi:membrane-bound inhibitor of C-type lysozyme